MKHYSHSFNPTDKGNPFW